MSFNQNLRYLRRKANLSQATLGDKLGVDYATIRNYESGKTEPRLELISKLAQIFNVSIEQLRNVDLTAPQAEEPSTTYNSEKVRQNPFAPPTKPAKHKMQVIIELDGTADCLERVYARLAIMNEAVAETD